MNLIPESPDIRDYLKQSDIIDWDNPRIQKIVDELKQVSADETELAKAVYEYVRDRIPHSFDISGNVVTYKASDVLLYGEGICFAKSHLLAAMMRCAGIPAGFCYQKLVFDDSNPNYMTLHGLNAIYLKNIGKWIRLDARGNKPGVDARFLIDGEQLAFPVREIFGEQDYPTIYVNPNVNVLKSLQSSQSQAELRINLPVELQVSISLTSRQGLIFY